MKLHSIQLTNFRQFYGKTPKIEFAQAVDRNVTVIHGMNGAGKTAFLNAFTWALYNTFSKGFRNPDQLINRRAIAEAEIGTSVECTVELVFDHAGETFRVKRCVEGIRTSKDEYPTLRSKEHSLLVRGTDNEWAAQHDVDTVIGRILPRDLHSYFFFDGERVERIVDPRREDRADLAKAVKTLLGLEIMERSIKHLKRAQRYFEEEIAKYGNSETKELVARKEQAVDNLETIENALGQLSRNIEDQTELLGKLEDRMRKLGSVATHQKRKDELVEEIRSLKESLKQNEQLIKAKISDHAYMCFTAEISTHFTTTISELRSKGELPAGIKKQFVERLLAENLCICGRALESSIDTECKEARTHIEKWLTNAGLQELEDGALRLGARIETWSDRRIEIGNRFDELIQQGKLQIESLSNAQAEFERITKELEGSPEEDVSALQKKINVETKLRDEYISDLGVQTHNQKQKLSELKKLEEELDKVEAKDAKQELAKRRRAATDEVVVAMAEILKLMDKKWRSSLESKIQSIFREISIKPYIPKLRPDYSILLGDSLTGDEVAFSQGESLVLSFSFISAIIEETKEMNAQQSAFRGRDSGQYPLIMDSPFGALDETNRSHVASKISILADQVVTMVSKTQWREEVETAMGPRIGRTWVLTYHNPRADAKESSILIDSKAYPLVTRSADEHEFTTIMEV